MLRVYHVAGTRSVRIVWLLKELGLAHEVVSMPFDHAVMHGPDYLGINPLGKVPALDHDGFVLTESGAIIQYILARYGQGRLEPSPRPQPGTPAHARFLQWLYFPEATMMPPLGALVRQSRRAEASRNAEITADALDKAAGLLAYCEHELAPHGYLLGPEFTAADIMLGYTLALADYLDLVGEGHPRIAAYLGRLGERPAFREAQAA
jgi:glutathione S-transferase